MERIEVDFAFRERLNQVLGGGHHNYCYQSGACVSVCPTARHTDVFNPRAIMLKTLLGLEHHLIEKGSVIWYCTNCYSCYERCPQDVRPIEVIIALKNMAFAKGTAPDEITKFSENIENTGVAATLTASVHSRRKELGLAELKPVPVNELKELLKK